MLVPTPMCTSIFQDPHRILENHGFMVNFVIIIGQDILKDCTFLVCRTIVLSSSNERSHNGSDKHEKMQKIHGCLRRSHVLSRLFLLDKTKNVTFALLNSNGKSPASL
jgi:hypothetical protein